MALAELMATLQQNTSDAQSRMDTAEQDLMEAGTQAMLERAASKARSGGGGGGNRRGNGGGATPMGDMPGKGGSSNWPSKGERHQHNEGYDWANWAGDINQPGSGDMGNRVSAYKSGVVSSVKRLKNSYGKHIRVTHPDGSETLYAHLSRIGVKPGQVVQGGQKIGRVGSTGNSSGPHLHFEIKD